MCLFYLISVIWFWILLVCWFGLWVGNGAHSRLCWKWQHLFVKDALSDVQEPEYFVLIWQDTETCVKSRYKVQDKIYFETIERKSQQDFQGVDRKTSGLLAFLVKLVALT